MARFWQSNSQKLSYSNDHVPESGENYYPTETLGCWNCGADFFVERPSLDSGLEYKLCPVCDGNGEIQTSLQTFPYDPVFLSQPPPNVIFTLNGVANVWDKFWA